MLMGRPCGCRLRVGRGERMSRGIVYGDSPLPPNPVLTPYTLFCELTLSTMTARLLCTRSFVSGDVSKLTAAPKRAAAATAGMDRVCPSTITGLPALSCPVSTCIRPAAVCVPVGRELIVRLNETAA